MMQVSAIENEIDESFETNDRFFARSKTFAILFLFSLLKVAKLVRNVFKFFLTVQSKMATSAWVLFIPTSEV